MIKHTAPPVEGFKYPHGDFDYYGYQPFDGRCFYLEGRLGEMLIGDGLPVTEEEAIAYCRIANLAYEQGIENTQEKFKKAMTHL